MDNETLDTAAVHDCSLRSLTTTCRKASDHHKEDMCLQRHLLHHGLGKGGKSHCNAPPVQALQSPHYPALHPRLLLCRCVSLVVVGSVVAVLDLSALVLFVPHLL